MLLACSKVPSWHQTLNSTSGPAASMTSIFTMFCNDSCFLSAKTLSQRLLFAKPNDCAQNFALSSKPNSLPRSSVRAKNTGSCARTAASRALSISSGELATPPLNTDATACHLSPWSSCSWTDRGSVACAARGRTLERRGEATVTPVNANRRLLGTNVHAPIAMHTFNSVLTRRPWDKLAFAIAVVSFQANCRYTLRAWANA
mmetsp:Transcript_12242/g.22661  ORF Transcript_12242/g.22661 Transcript_12242/m.22661 type:complete len:202 (-) Transcript_12242:2-607(-)